MARKKPIKKSKLAPQRTSPVQPGTIEIAAPTMFGTKVVAIRSNAEAAKGAIPSPSLGVMLREITSDLPAQREATLIGPERLVKSLIRNREIQKRMVLKCQEAAEAAWPGFGAMLDLMVERENEFTAALGELGVGVA